MAMAGMGRRMWLLVVGYMALGAFFGHSAEAASAFKICENQTYALCASAKCSVLNDVAYCRCDIKHGDSISLPLQYAPNKDVCTANAAGVTNGYMVSTFSLPPSVVSGIGRKALYNCPGSTSNGAYAQCDGGFCFKSTKGQHFPGLPAELTQDEIICSCPITVAVPPVKIGFQIAGPYPCQSSFFANCNSPPATGKTGSIIYVGAPTGVPRLLARELNGSVPPLNVCNPPAGS